MTAAVVILSATVAGLVALVAALVLRKTPHQQLLDLGGDLVDARAREDKATRDLAVRTQEVQDRDQTIAKLKAQLAATEAERDAANARAVVHLPDDQLRAVGNGVPPDGGGRPAGAVPGGDAAPGGAVVPGPGGTAAGAIGGDLR